MTRPIEYIVAETAVLTEAQRTFREAAHGRLDFALPVDVWFEHHYGVLPIHRGSPVARRKGERWFDVTQVVKRAVDPRSRRHVRFVSGGLSSGVGRKSRK